MPRLVLIVDDSETCAETLQIALELVEGIEVRIVSSPRAAVATLSAIPRSQLSLQICTCRNPTGLI